MTNFSKWLTVSPWEASESRGAAPPAEPWSLGSSGRQSLTPTCRTTAGGAPGGGGPCPHVWPARPQTRTGVLVKIPAYALSSLSHGLEARVRDESPVDSVSGESPILAGGATVRLHAHRARPRCVHTRRPPASSSPEGTNPSWPTLTTSSNPTHLQRPTSKHCCTG